MAAGPTVPPPPALLSMVTGWPRILEALSAIARIEISVDPPAGHGTIRVIGLVGYSCAPALAPISAPSVARIIVKPVRRNIIIFSLAAPASRKPILLFSLGFNLPRK